MINVSNQIQEYYKADSTPGPITVVIGNETYGAGDRPMGSMSIKESLCSGDMLDFSAVEKSSAEFSLFNFDQSIADIQGETAEIYQTVLQTRIPLGVYTITKAETSGEHILKITAYDNLVKFDRDVSEWWNDTVTFPISARALLISLCNYCGVQYSLPNSYCNSAFSITQNIKVEDTTGAEFLGYLQEVSGCFFRCDRNGILRRIAFDSVALSPDTYEEKMEDPDVTYDYSVIISDLSVADYDVQKIDKLQVRGTDDDIGIVVGTGTNAYIIQANPLLYSLDSSAASTAIVNNIFQSIKDITYRPFSAKVKDLPYIECGDMVNIVSYRGIEATSPLFSRTMTGGSLIFDELECNGRETRTTQVAVNRQIKVLNQKMLEIVQTVEEFSTTLSEVQDETTELQTQIMQTSEEISLTTSRTTKANSWVNSDFADTELSNFDPITIVSGGHTIGTWSVVSDGNEKVLAFTFDNAGFGDYLEATKGTTQLPTDRGHAILVSGGQIIDPNIAAGRGYQWNVSLKYTDDSSVVRYVYGYVRAAGNGQSPVFSSWGYFPPATKSDYVRQTMYGTLASGITYYTDRYNIIPYVQLSVHIESSYDEIRNASPIVLYFKQPYLAKDVVTRLPKEVYNSFSSDDATSQINLSTNGVKIKGEKIDIQGITTFSSDSGNTTVIDGGTLKGQTLQGVTLQVLDSSDNVVATMRKWPSGDGFQIAGSGAFAFDCSKIYIAPTDDLYVKIPAGESGAGAFAHGFKGDVTFKNWDGNLVKLKFVHGIAWYFSTTGWSSGGGYTGTINGMYFKNGILMTYNGSEGSH